MTDLAASSAEIDIEATQTATADARRRRRMLVLLMAMIALCHFNRISISVAGAEHLMEEYGIGEARMGMVYSSYLLVYTLCMLPGGWLIDRFGPWRAFLTLGIGSSILVPMTGLASFATTSSVVLVLCLIRGLLGVVSAPLHPAAARAVSFWYPPSGRGAANGLVTGAALLGIAVTYTVFGFLMDLVGWPSAFVAAGVATLLLTLAWWAWAGDRSLIDDEEPTPIPAGGSEGRAAFVALLRNRSLVFLTISYATVSYFQYLFFYWMQYYFDVILKLGKADGRLFTMIPTLAMAFGMMAGGWLADRVQARFPGRIGRIAAPAFAMLASAILLAMGVLGDRPVWVVACFTLAMGALGASESPFWVTSVELGGRRGGLSAAILNTGGNLGGMLAPVVTPLFSGYFGWKAGLGLASALCVVGAGLWLWIDPEEETIVKSVALAMPDLP
ncbi:MFS transporter [Paludisphaera borealis]|uniref:D-galactonate transporter n=1 Tax=Paludisphaera borealis TaxID=1387353 RepID=A0A1U7CIQ9_9BACT|nr:MFS transporter [Paludisphaera borealis]APW58825.1 D-galactonate transporter [Paludisphaera borealis]